MVYKSKELVDEEQAIVEEALNGLADGIEKEMTREGKEKYTNKELKRKIKELEQLRVQANTERTPDGG